MTNYPPSQPHDPAQSLRSNWQTLLLLQPYLGRLALLSLAAVGLSFLAGITQIALTPLLEIVLGISGISLSAPVAEGGGVSFDLSHLGTLILYRVSNITGLDVPEDLWPLLVIISLTYLMLTLIGQASTLGTRQWGLRIRLHIIQDLRYRAYTHILRLPLSFLRRYQAGWILSRLLNDTRYAAIMVNNLIVDGLSNVLLSAFYVYLLIRTDVRLTVVAAIAGTIQIVFSQIITGTVTQRTRIERRVEAKVGGALQERLNVLREVKALAGESYEQQSVSKIMSEFSAASYRQQAIQHSETPIRTMINQTVLVGVMIFGMKELLDGRLTTSAFLLFMFFAQRLIGPLSSLAGIMLQATTIAASLEGVAFILDQENEATGGRTISRDHFKESITLENVHFSYDDSSMEMPVLHDLNLTIKRGDMVAIVGRSGAGKSTLVDLILRFFPPTAGQIKIDGVPIQDYDLTAYRRLFGTVSQDGALFDDTVYENIAYARPYLTREEVEQAARIANAEDFILHDLDEGYNTRLGERGVRLSGGQRQRIAIARAVAHRPPILILDEATSSLDSESEHQVQEAIARVIKGSTAIVIAHRLSTIRMADQIVVLKDGCIVETGTHEELLAQEGEYRYLYDLQFRVEDKTVAV